VSNLINFFSKNKENDFTPRKGSYIKTMYFGMVDLIVQDKKVRGEEKESDDSGGNKSNHTR